MSDRDGRDAYAKKEVCDDETHRQDLTYSTSRSKLSSSTESFRNCGRVGRCSTRQRAKAQKGRGIIGSVETTHDSEGARCSDCDLDQSASEKK